MTQSSTTMIEDQEDERSNLNSTDLGINRGFELMLRQDKREEEPEPKKFHLIFGKVLSLFKREIGLHIELYFDYKK